MNVYKSCNSIKQPALPIAVKPNVFQLSKENKILISNILLSIGTLFASATIITSCTFLAVPITATLIVKTAILGFLTIAFITAGLLLRKNNDKTPPVTAQSGQMKNEVDRSLQIKITSVNNEPIVNHKAGAILIAQMPIAQAHEPLQQAETPTIQVYEPLQQTEISTIQVQEPLQQTESPTTQVQEPLRQAEMPITQVQKPLGQPETPITQVQEPLQQTESPTTQVQEPLRQAEMPITQVHESLQQAETPITQVQEPLQQTKTLIIPQEPLQQAKTQPPQPQVQPTLPLPKPAPKLNRVLHKQELPFLSAKHNLTFNKENQLVLTKQSHLPNLLPGKKENQLALTKLAPADQQIVLLNRTPQKINLAQAFQAVHKLGKKDLLHIQCFLNQRVAPLSIRIFNTSTKQNFNFLIHEHPIKKNRVNQKNDHQKALALSDTSTKPIFDIHLSELTALASVHPEALELVVETEEAPKKSGFWANLTTQVGTYATKENVIAALTIGGVILKAFAGTKNGNRPDSDDRYNASLRNTVKVGHDQKTLLSQHSNLAECTPDGAHLVPLNYKAKLPNSEAPDKHVIQPGQPGYVKYQKEQQEQNEANRIIKIYDPRNVHLLENLG